MITRTEKIILRKDIEDRNDKFYIEADMHKDSATIKIVADWCSPGAYTEMVTKYLLSSDIIKMANFLLAVGELCKD